MDQLNKRNDNWYAFIVQNKFIHEGTKLVEAPCKVTIIIDDNENINDSKDLNSHGDEGFTIYIHTHEETTSNKKHENIVLVASPMSRRFTQSMAKQRAKKHSIKFMTPIASYP